MTPVDPCVQCTNRRRRAAHSAAAAERGSVSLREVDARTQSALLAAIVCLALAVAMLLRQGRTRLWTAFALLNFALLPYQVGDFLHRLLGTQTWPLRLALAAAAFIPGGVVGVLVAL